MKKLSAKIIIIIIIVFGVSTIIPRIILTSMGDFPEQEFFSSPLFLVGMFVTAFLTLSLFGLAIKYVIIDRIRSLSLATKQIALGNFELNIKSKGNDELTSLTQDFNKMAQELRANEYLNKEFVRNFSHEFKTPISAIKGYAELISSGDLTDKEIVEYSKIIASESTRLTHLSKSLLQLSILDSTSIVKANEKFNMSEQIRSVIQMLQLMWEEKGLELNLDIQEIYTTTNKELTYQIWKNIIENAINYSQKNQKLDITVKQEEKQIIFEITNYGLGISLEDQKHIYELFYVVEKSRHQTSSGIGLAITKKIIDKLNGDIHIDSQENEYTTFKVSLPI
ncbi:sensor histidine kinase [Mariniplasma anaerobium]|uniref:Heme sensor protein HssS n=1 Tax=Mariniplasma anaerobium TaxID=2735436 RepID=A0A7U9TJC0_9MOLU|nr:HAMP domain-containing sensor histidine kinase [Mariniplasma anaerobium]BCR35246.1 two component sensor kinase [Mariniplasma anaerobium]